jgi:hypothetical protein
MIPKEWQPRQFENKEYILIKHAHNKNYYVKYDGKIYDIVLTIDINQAKRYRDKEHAERRNVGNYEIQAIKRGLYV